MKKIRSGLRSMLPSGLAAKLIRAVIAIFLFVGLESFGVTHFQMGELERLVRSEGENLTAQIKADSVEAMDALTRNSLEDLAIRAADKTDDELWVNSYELKILSSMVSDVFTNPENYNPITPKPPAKANKGKLALQLLVPSGYENIDPDTMDMLGRLSNLAPIMASYIGDYTVDIYISLPDGSTLAMDKMSDGKFDESGNIKPYDARTRHWYKEAVKTKDLYFSQAMHSFFYNYDIVVYSLPVYVDGDLVAVLEGSLKLDKLRERVNYVLLGENAFNILVNQRGQLVSTSRTVGELQMPDDLDADIRNIVSDPLKKLINTGLSGESGTCIVEVDGQEYYAGYGPLVTVGWTQISFVALDEMLEPANALVKETIDSSERMHYHVSNGFNKSILVISIVLGTIFIGTIIVVSRIARKRVEPINHMTRKVKEITGNDMEFVMEDIYKTGDEIETLAKAFEDQTDKLKIYMEDNLRITAEKERIDAEMSLATEIQSSMLPKIEPDFSDRPGYELYAFTEPAKSVGGDFYDFFYIDEDHLALVIADVSGKGITAALFMALSKQMIRSQMLLTGGDVVEAVSRANTGLIEESIKDMFVTVWAGVVTLSTGELVFVDAGHEYPAIQRNNSGYTIDKDNHSMAVAALKKAKYKLNETKLEPGDTLYLYTDGVTEAHDEAGKMFGMDRLNDALNECAGKNPEETDRHIRERLAEFTGNAEQFDDITTLCFKYNGLQTYVRNETE